MGIGKSGEYVDRDKLEIKFGDFIVAEKGKFQKVMMNKKLKSI